MLITLCIIGFFAAFVDSIAGGGGLISLPAFLMSGLSPHLALGTNKLSASMGSVTSSYHFIKSKKVDVQLMCRLIPFTLLGAMIGVNTTLHIPGKILNLLILILIIFIAIYTLFSKTLGKENHFEGLTKKNIQIGALFAFCLGFYDGFFGPGTGSFLLFGFIKLYGFDFTLATGNARLLNCVSNFTSLIVFALNHKINYAIGLPVGLCMIVGAKLGSIVAINKGIKLIKPLFILMSLGMVIKLALEIL